MAKICDRGNENRLFKIRLLNEEYAKLVALPDEEFLEAADKRDSLRKEILTELKKANKPSHRSKYFNKHYQVEEAELDEVQCGHCKKIFAVDYEWLDYFTANVDEDWARCYCPYCGKIKQWCI